MEAILRGATVLDGTGAPARRADVALDGDRIVAVRDEGDLAAEARDARTVVDLDGLVLAPGFIDPHTHYDAQVLWDPDLTPSTWHGVTTVVMGNCGFGIAPTRPEHRDTIIRVLENVEGMPLDALEAGIRWEFESFPEYLDVVDATATRANTAVLLGHTPLRFAVLGDDATEREATRAELATMRALTHEAIAAGAIGFSTSRSAGHVGAYGKPVPSRAASFDEVRTLDAVLGERGQGTFEAAYGPDLWVDEFGPLSDEIGRPVTWAAIVTQAANPNYAAGLVERTVERGGDVHPQIACRPLVVQIMLSDPFPFANVPAFAEVLRCRREDRVALCADPEWLARARTGTRELWGGVIDSVVVAETTRHHHLVDGPTMRDLADERGVDPLDVMVDLALAERLATRFRITMTNDDEAQIGKLLQDRRLLLGLSDAGAHTSQLCDANYATHLLSRFVRERGDITIEDAVWRLSGHPASVYGLMDRGTIRPGAAADLVAFDPATIGTGRIERVRDFPGGADRLVSRPTGIEHVWVNGRPVRRAGRDLDGARPGRLLRNGR
jgi:N-acyl-D-aspartate/D-glutamate deacylase